MAYSEHAQTVIWHELWTSEREDICNRFSDGRGSYTIIWTEIESSDISQQTWFRDRISIFLLSAHREENIDTEKNFDSAYLMLLISTGREI